MLVTLARVAFYKGSLDPSQTFLQQLNDYRNYFLCRAP